MSLSQFFYSHSCWCRAPTVLYRWYTLYISIAKVKQRIRQFSGNAGKSEISIIVQKTGARSFSALFGIDLIISLFAVSLCCTRKIRICISEETLSGTVYFVESSLLYFLDSMLPQIIPYCSFTWLKNRDSSWNIFENDLFNKHSHSLYYL